MSFRKWVVLLAIPLLAAGLLWAVRPAPSPSARSLVEGLQGRGAVYCFDQLRQLETEEAEQAVVAGTRHRRPRIRGQCARLLGLRKDIAMVPFLEPLLGDPDPGVQAQAAKAIIPLLDDRELLELLRGNRLTPAARLSVVRAVLREPGAIADAALLDWLLDRGHDPELRQRAFLALADSGIACKPKKNADPVLLAARQRIFEQAKADAFDPQCNLLARSGAMQLYAAFQGSAAFAELLPLTRAPQPGLREAALLALAATKDERVAPLLCAVSKDKTQPVSTRAVALGALPCFRWNGPALETARLALNDPEPRLRAQAARAVGILGDKNAPAHSPSHLGPSLEVVKKALAREQDPDAQCALRGALCSLEARQRDHK